MGPSSTWLVFLVLAPRLISEYIYVTKSSEESSGLHSYLSAISILLGIDESNHGHFVQLQNISISIYLSFCLSFSILSENVCVCMSLYIPIHICSFPQRTDIYVYTECIYICFCIYRSIYGYRHTHIYIFLSSKNWGFLYLGKVGDPFFHNTTLNFSDKLFFSLSGIQI